jgi:hypothetical protein
MHFKEIANRQRCETRYENIKTGMYLCMYLCHGICMHVVVPPPKTNPYKITVINSGA